MRALHAGHCGTLHNSSQHRRAPISSSSSSSHSSHSGRACSSIPQQRRAMLPAAAAAAAGGTPASSSSSGGDASSTAAAAVVEGRPVSPFTEEDLRGLSEVESLIDEEALATAWRENFEGDLDGLFSYVDRAHATLREKVQELHSIPKHLWDKVGVLDELSKFPPGLVADMMGLGTWRMNGMVDEVFAFMTGRIEHSFRELLDTDLAMYPADKWKDKGWDFIDSLDPKQEWGGFSYMDMPNPAKGQEGYPRLMVENRIYSSRVFRKLHLELATRQDGLQVMHMVMYPRYDFDIPILALDLVAAGGAVTLAIIDACPVSPRLNLPQHYSRTMLELQHEFLPESLLSSEGRNIPAWGSAIFSPLCLCITPKTPEELSGFMKYAVALTRAHLLYSQLLEPLRPTSKPSARRLQELLACHKRFCEQQLANKKTSRVLEAAFDAEFTQQYMEQLMFDYSPNEDVPWYDGSLARLYDYFEEKPEIWKDADLFLKTKLQLDGAKASDYLRRFLSGDPSIKLPRLSFAMQHMYNTDSDFQASVDRYISGLPLEQYPTDADMGEFLALRFMELIKGGEQILAEQQQEAVAAAAAAPEISSSSEGSGPPATPPSPQQQQDQKE